jgi:zinc resistance-associated protein
MKRNMIITTAVIAVLLTASLVFAGRYGTGNCPRQGGGAGSGPVLEQMTPEKQQAFETLRQTFRDRMLTLRDQMWVKRAELQALSVNPNTKPETLTGLVKELGDLRSTMQQERNSFHEQVRSEIGIELGKGRLGMGKRRAGAGQGCPGGAGFGRQGVNCPQQGSPNDTGKSRGYGSGQGMGPRGNCPNN